MRHMLLSTAAAIVLFVGVGLGSATFAGCNEQGDPNAKTSTQTTPGNLPLSPSSTTEPANPRGVTFKGAPVGADAGQQ